NDNNVFSLLPSTLSFFSCISLVSAIIFSVLYFLRIEMMKGLGMQEKSFKEAFDEVKEAIEKGKEEDIS
ncbi:MAG: hypothetical protein D6768_09915, partial [Chloroflexi bacterium]